MTNPAADRAALQSRPSFSLRNRVARQIWTITWALLFRTTPRPCHGWRRMLLRVFGANIAPNVQIYPQARIWAPWNLVAHRGATVASGAEVYNPATIELGEFCTISQGAYLCGATHEYASWEFHRPDGGHHRRRLCERGRQRRHP